MSTATRSEGRSSTMRVADRLAQIIPARPGTTPAGHRQLVESTVGVALLLTGSVRDLDPADTAGLVADLDAEQLAMLSYVLAAMVDVDRTPRQLLAWTGWQQPIRYDGATGVSPAAALLGTKPRPTRSRECGTEGAYQDGCRCARCLIGHDGHKRDLAARTRAARRKARRATSPGRLVAVHPTLPFEGDANAA
jgi:hypothetical protein